MNLYNFKNGQKIDIKKMLADRNTVSYGEYEKKVNDILEAVKSLGDEAVFEFTEKFDHTLLTASSVKVSKDEIEEAYTVVDAKLIAVMQRAILRIEDYHKKQKTYSWFDTCEKGTILGQKVTPLEIVGVYVPGGKAAYPSSVLMNVIPAKVAGVGRIVMTTPPSKEFGGKVNPYTLVAADLCGINEIYKVGGAQAIGALAYGTVTIPKVDKIVGPGNIYVALAKKAVYGHVSIDSIAGPSEILVIADQSANPRFVAADLLSQAEHDELASAVLITTDAQLAEQVQVELNVQVEQLAKKTIAKASLERYGAIIIVDTIQEAINITNDIAPEHLELCVTDPFSVMPKITNAGAIFMGHYSPEPLGDYMAGPNHILPTNATAKFFSPLSVDDFIKKSSIIAFNEEGLKDLYKDIMVFANAEGLTGHANSVKVRFEE